MQDHTGAQGHATPGSPRRFLYILVILTYKWLIDSAQISSKSVRPATKINVRSHNWTAKDAQYSEIQESHVVNSPASDGLPLLASFQWQGS